MRSPTADWTREEPTTEGPLEELLNPTEIEALRSVHREAGRRGGEG